ncbi:aldose 1-epimerase family protein [Cellulomonas marina]|uniref:Aldose 1-epimerase n=1 Tax=Cellulomonas marina TaxID=988821 RepID=A0A1I0V1K3_9CELL|nr:aldose 1-epimerase family protein [Cellulomonas marina]GIG28260.1 aldose 1-epimerase [Cellulomonas marina]SFA70112.1 aldose 1-epimerase [Cellulomonas marina]
MNIPFPSGGQHPLSHGDHQAVVTEVGASLRLYAVGGRDVVVPFAPEELAPAFSGALLAPWPNRLRDGQFTWAGTEHQVAVSEPDRSTALHGLVAKARFSVVEATPSSVTLEHRLVPTDGYPWPLVVEVTYALSDEGLRVTTRTTNLGADEAPYGLGFHPWLAPAGTVDDCVLQVGAERHVTVDERLLPTGTEPVAGTFDLREPVSLRGVALDDAWVEPVREADGRTWARLTGGDGRTAAMWADDAFAAWQVCTGDGIPRVERGGVAVEPMTCIADAFRTGDDVVVLGAGATHEATWGLTLV